MTNLFIIAQAAGSNNWLMIIGIFGAIVTGVYLLADFLLGSKNKTESRLDRMSGRVDSTVAASPKQSISERLKKASPKIAEALKPKSEKEKNSQQKLLNEAGWRQEDAPKVFASLRFFCGIGGFIFGGGLGLLSTGLTFWPLVYAMVVGTLFTYLPQLFLVLACRSRKQKLFLGLPDSLDLMVVCVEAGLGMDQALRRVADEMVDTHPVVAHEFQVCNQQLQYGSTRETVLTELGERNGVDDLKTLASVMIQVDKFGTSVGKALRIQSEAMRTRRRQLAEEKASKTAVKLIFPLVLFIFPGIFVVLVGPAAITMMEELLPMMNGGGL